MMNVFWTKKLEVVLVGLENSGKTTLLNVLSNGVPVETAPTIGLNVKMVKRGGVQMKCWYVLDYEFLCHYCKDDLIFI